MSKTPGVKISLDSALVGAKVGPTAGHNSRGIADAMATNGRPHAAWDKPPMATTHVPHAVTREERFHAGNPGTPNRLNEIEGARGETMGLDKKTGSAMHDTPVSSKGRQMPDRDIISKAGEVARELQTQGNGEGFPKGGAMDDR